MEIAKLVLEYWKASVWPLVFVIAVLIFRDQIRDALRRARAIDAMGVNVELAERVDEVREALEEAQDEVAGAPEEGADQTATRRPVVSPEIAANAAKALAAVKRVRHEPSFRGSPTPAFKRLQAALRETSIAFDRGGRYTSGMMTWLTAETGLTGWPVVWATYQLLWPSVVGAPEAVASELNRLADEALDALVSLLEETAQGRIEESTP